MVAGRNFDIKNLSPRDIDSIKIFKGDQAIELYGETGKNGVIKLYTKAYIPDQEDITEYDIVVMDAGFDNFVLTQLPKEFYSEQYLKTGNIILTSEWNMRTKNPLLYSPEIYESEINYNPSTKYGLDFEYKLYMFFKFIDKKYDTALMKTTTRSI